jgi:hypothetical protein
MAVAIVRLSSSCCEKGGDREGEVEQGQREVAREDVDRVLTALGDDQGHIDGRYLLLQRPHVPEPQGASVADEEVKVHRERARAGGGSAYARVAESGERVFVVIVNTRKEWLLILAMGVTPWPLLIVSLRGDTEYIRTARMVLTEMAVLRLAYAVSEGLKPWAKFWNPILFRVFFVGVCLERGFEKET